MERKKPIIGLTSSFEHTETTERVFLPLSYFQSIRHFGGIPLLLPVYATQEELEYLLDQCDGVILTGGDDIDPSLYGEEKLNDTVEIAPERDSQEGKVIDLAMARNLPILGICRGIQMLNVHLGGSLYQDIPAQIPSEVAHRMEKPYHRASHECRLVPGTPMYALCGREVVGVNSHHHQAVKDPAPSLRVMGRAEDGIIEALYDPEKPFVWAVQWHPERIWDIEDGSAKLFEAFIEACRKEERHE